MKKKSILSILLVGVLALGLVGCGSTEEKAGSEDDKKIVIGVSPVPHAEIVKEAIPALEEKGYTVEVKEFTDYVTPNRALFEGDLDANFFQHTPYLNSQNEDHSYDLVSVGEIHLEPLGLYSKKVKNLDELQDGAVIAIPNDPSNGARALRLIEAQGLIKVKDGEKITPKDITENPKNLEFKEIDAAQLPKSLEDVDAAIINGNYALENNIVFDELGLAKEDPKLEEVKPYSNLVAVKEANKDSQKIKDLVEALTSEKIKDFIEDKYNGAVIPAF